MLSRMSPFAPIYTAQNCNPAYQLNWSLTIFWKSSIPPADLWLEPLKCACVPDHIRILEHTARSARMSQLLVSTRPAVSPKTIVQRVKSRLQHIIRSKYPDVLERRFGLRALGSANRETVDQYVASQIDHHPVADPRFAKSLKQYQVHQPDVDLREPYAAAHGRYWYNLHVVLVTGARFRFGEKGGLQLMQTAITNTAAKHGDRLARAGILPDHIHIVLGGSPLRSPEDVALSYMNNIAFRFGMNAVLQFGYYVGTFGEYSRAAIRARD